MHSTCLEQAQLCHPKIGYVNAMLLRRSRHTSYQFTSGPLQWRQRILSPNTRPETHGEIQSSFPPTATCLSLNYNKHNPSHVRRHTLPSQPSQLLITQFRLNTHNPTHHESCSTKSKPNIPCCKIKLISKNTFRPILSSSPFLYLLLKLSEGTNNTWRGSDST